MNNTEQTIEELSLSRSSKDLWDEFNSDINFNTLLYYLPPNIKVTFRLLGPFVRIQRFYAPFLRYCPNINIEAVANKDPNAIQDAIRIIRERADKNGMAVDGSAIKYLQELPSQMTWQKSIMVNIYSKTLGIKAFCLTRNLSTSIVIACQGRGNIILSGLSANDISVTKRGSGMNITFDVKIDNQTTLPNNEINKILSNGLIDIPALLQGLNNAKKSSYYYKILSGYRMPSEFMETLIKERIPIEEDQHLISTEEHLDEIPVDAFERRNSFRSAIGSLEV